MCSLKVRTKKLKEQKINNVKHVEYKMGQDRQVVGLHYQALANQHMSHENNIDVKRVKFNRNMVDKL